MAFGDRGEGLEGDIGLGGGGGEVGLDRGAVELGGGEARDWEQLRFFVEGEGLLAVKVDGKSGDAQDGGGDADQLGGDLAAGGADHGTASEGEVPIEPGVPEPAAVGLDADLDVGTGLAEFFGDGLDAEGGGVGVSAEESHAIAGLRVSVDGGWGRGGGAHLPLGTDGEGDDGGAIAGEEVAAAGLDGGGPGVAFADLAEAGV